MSDCIEWYGGECPIPDGVKYEIQFYGCKPLRPSCDASAFRWHHIGDSGDIVAYRIIESDDTIGKEPINASVSDGSTASYYVLPECAKELQDLISYRDMNAQLGEIFRACYRYGLASHSDKMRDAKKIRFYIEAEIQRLEKYTDV